ncbi:MAG: hypothetical protein KAR40_06125 [Candidatus Sabulitectum sp.]|nr:hypothetical protein [Candidatus Sabulitectum sp.]
MAEKESSIATRQKQELALQQQRLEIERQKLLVTQAEYDNKKLRRLIKQDDEESKSRHEHFIAQVAGHVAEMQEEQQNIDFQPYDLQYVESIMPPDWDKNRHAYNNQLLVDVLNSVATTGSRHQASLCNGAQTHHIGRLMKDYPGLDEAIEDAKARYRELVRRTVHKRGVLGWIEPVYQGGAVVGFKQKFSERALEMQAKRIDPEYRDKSEVDVNVGGSVLIIGQPSESKDEWLEKQRKKQDNVIEGEVTDES